MWVKIHEVLVQSEDRTFLLTLDNIRLHSKWSAMVTANKYPPVKNICSEFPIGQE